MNELIRSHYLGAMGIDSYISRSQLPGAAPTPRLAIVTHAPTAVEARPALEAPREDAKAQAGAATIPPMPKIEGFTRPAAAVPSAAFPDGGQFPGPEKTEQVRFSLAAVIVGSYLWLEELQGVPLAREQVQLIQGMARALGARETAVVSQFDWPMHSNRQLDLGGEAAKASVAGFLGRHIDQRHCTGLVLLGEPVVQRVELEQIGVVQSVATRSTTELLGDPMLKKTVWKDLQTLLG